jgi:hypothetical protein
VYYISPTGNDTNSGTTSGAPWKTFTKAWSVLQAGNTLIVADGTYTNASPPAGKSGSVGNPITVQAANDGGAEIHQQVDFRGTSYLSFVGLNYRDRHSSESDR